MKITKGKNLIGKGKYKVKTGNQPCRKLVGRLKDKHNIIYIYNKQLRDRHENVKHDIKNTKGRTGIVKNLALLQYV